MMEINFSWIEWVGFVTALIYLYFSVNQKIWLWPMGILTSAFYMVVFFDARLYADMGLQLYYFVVSIVGWVMWKSRQKQEHKQKTSIVKIDNRDFLSLAIAFVALYFLLSYMLLKLPEQLGLAASDLPYWDAFTTAASFVATWMLAKKMIDQWIVWIIVDFVAMGMYIYKGLYITAFLFFVYTVIAIWGYVSWLKDYKLQCIDVEDV